MLNKIKEFLNNSWGYLVAGISVIFGLVLFRKKVDHYANVVQKLDDSHQKQLRELKKAREEEQEKYEENERKHHERMAAVEKEYETSKKELSEYYLNVSYLNFFIAKPGFCSKHSIA